MCITSSKLTPPGLIHEELSKMALAQLGSLKLIQVSKETLANYSKRMHSALFWWLIFIF
uniref:Uncharacterized protein n=1 Tax=Physcomitrium patens TaxID=3218 RepID=A0A2K1JU44_PHYPA|nr:hypothetical protein PHYPA_014823 [Physcomitrium patens]